MLDNVLLRIAKTAILQKFDSRYEIDELKLLLIHGLLHLIGYDHETDNGEMREKEREIITHFKLPNSLIIRNS